MPSKQRTVWTTTGLQTARADLIEHGYLYVTYDEALDSTGVAKIRELDRYLLSNGIVFERTRFGEGMQKYEVKRIVKEQFWNDDLPVGCALCPRQFTERDQFIDGATRGGPWAIMCRSCFAHFGVGLGPGMGQLYSYRTRQKLDG